MTTDQRLLIIAAAKRERDARTPYIWGGATSSIMAGKPGFATSPGLDCSGFVIAMWQELHLVGRTFDTTAHGLFHSCPAVRLDQLQGADLAFYGRHPARHKPKGFHVTHVAIYTGRDASGIPIVIHAAGGGPSFLTAAFARARGACVKQAPLLRRRDFLGCGSVAHFPRS